MRRAQMTYCHPTAAHAVNNLLYSMANSFPALALENGDRGVMVAVHLHSVVVKRRVRVRRVSPSSVRPPQASMGVPQAPEQGYDVSFRNPSRLPRQKLECPKQDPSDSNRLIDPAVRQTSGAPRAQARRYEPDASLLGSRHSVRNGRSARASGVPHHRLIVRKAPKPDPSAVPRLTRFGLTPANLPSGRSGAA